MKLYSALIPVLLLFAYSVSVLERSGDVVTLDGAKAVVEKDLSKFTPSETLVINQ